MTSPLSTPRLAIVGAELRAWDASDSQKLVQAWQDAEIAAWNPVPPQPDISTATRWINGVNTRERNRTSIDVVIDVGGHVGVVGEVGLSGFSDRHDGAMIGYWLLPEGRGLGLATAAVRAMTQWAHDELGLGVVVARCDPNNPASGAVVARVGYDNERTDVGGHELWMSRAREA